jgi:chromosome segregation ATPase
MLGQTLIVRDRAAARRLIRDLPAHARVVTLRGEVFRGDGLDHRRESPARVGLRFEPAAPETRADRIPAAFEGGRSSR